MREAGRRGVRRLAQRCIAGKGVRFRRMRHLALFLAVLFFANNAAAGVLACVAGLAGQGQLAVHASDGMAGAPACPQSDESGPCLVHYAQSHPLDEQNTWAGVATALLVPAQNLPRFAVPAQPKPLVLASAPPLVGPPLTILYGNFRN